MPKRNYSSFSDYNVELAIARMVANQADKYARKNLDQYLMPQVRTRNKGPSGATTQTGKGGFKQDLSKGKDDIRRYIQNPTPAQRAANNSTETQDSASRAMKVNYNIPGYNSSTAVGAGKRMAPSVITLGSPVYYDNAPDTDKVFNKKATIVTEFKFRMTSAPDERSHHYQAFRHKWSKHQAVETGAAALSTSGAATWSTYPEGTIALGPRHYPDSGSDIIAYKPPGVTSSATLDIRGTQPNGSTAISKRGYTYVSEINLNDLYDQSVKNSMNHLWYTHKLTGETGVQPNHAIPSRIDSHCRVSYAEHWNKGIQDSASGTTVEASGSGGFDNPSTPGAYTNRTQLIPLINKGKVEYAFSNKGVNAARVECIVYRIKKTANLPWHEDDYSAAVGATGNLGSKGVVGLVTEKHESAISLAYMKRQIARVATDNLGGADPVADDVMSNPKVKLLPQLSGIIASNDPLVEVSREAFVLAAGDKKNIAIKLPGIRTNPLLANKERRRGLEEVGDGAAVPTVHNFNAIQTPFDEHCYFICLATNGLLNTETIQTASTIPVAIGNIFAPSEIFCEAVYTEYVGACGIESDLFGNRAYNQGRVQPDTFAAGSTVSNAIIFPLGDASFKPTSQIHVQPTPT